MKTNKRRFSPATFRSVLAAMGLLCFWLSGGAQAGDLTADRLSVLDESAFYGPVSVRPLDGTAPTNGLVMYFSFVTNGQGTVTDGSGLGNNGTVYGATWTTNGMPGGAYDLAGATTDYIQVQGSASLNLVSNITMAGWAYFKGEGMNNGFVLSKQQMQSANNHLQYGLSRLSSAYGAQAHKFVASFYVGTWTDYISDYVLESNQWYFLAATYDRQSVKLYVNGLLNKSYSATSLITGDSTSRLTVGADANAPTWNEFANAIIDEARIYNRALSSVELKQLYLSCQPGYTPTNAALTVEGPATLKHVVKQGDIEMGGYTNGP